MSGHGFLPGVGGPPLGMGSALFTIEEIDPGTVLLTVAGELDASNVRELSRHVDAILDRRSGTLIVDLAELIHLDSSGLAELISVHQRAAANAMRLVLAFDSPGLRRTIEVRGLDSIFTIVDTREDAVGAPREA